MEAAAHMHTVLRVLETVLCLECGSIYSKPVAGGTVMKNPGCPDCGYVGWIPLTIPEVPPEPQLRSVADRRRRRLDRSR